MIKGPSNTICSERVTKRSPKKKNTVKPWKPLSPHAVIRSSSNEESVTSTISDNKDHQTENEKYTIPLEYEIHSNQVSFTYYPLVQGEHRIAVLSHGQHVSDSTYLVNVEPAVQGPKPESMAHIKSVLKPSRRHQKSEEEQQKKSAVRFQEPSERKERLGQILKRQVLRYIVKIDGKDVVVDADSISNLATSLLKMDYELQKRPLIRRNSWGFVGDAERKISVIRQFGIDIDEIESQSIKMQRSHSLSLSPITKKPPKISSSYECEDIPQTILETVTEGRVSYFNSSVSHEEDEVFALVNRDFDCHFDVKSNGAVNERKNFDFNSWKYTGNNFFDNNFYGTDVKEVDQSSATRQEQLPQKFEVPDSQDLISAVGKPEDNLRSTNECFLRLDTHVGEECVAEDKSKIKTESVSLDSKNKSQTTQLPSIHDDVVTMGKSDQELNLVETKKRIADVENSIGEFQLKSLGAVNTIFAEELPCTKTDVKTLSNYNYQKNIFTSSDLIKTYMNKYENPSSNKRISCNNCEDSMSRKESNNFVKNCEHKFSKKIHTSAGNLNNSVKNQHSMSDQLKSKIINIPKIGCKSFTTSNAKKNKTRGQRFPKYQHLGQKFQGNYDYCCTKRNRSSSKSSIEESSKKLQFIMKNVNYEDISNLSKMALFKFAKNRTVSDPTYNSFNRNEEHKNLELTRNEKAVRAEKYEDTERNCKHISDSSRNEYGTTFWPETSNTNTEFTNLTKHLRKNFNICQNAKTSSALKFPMMHESFSECAMNSTQNQLCASFVGSNCENSPESNQSKGSRSKNLCQFTYKHFNPSFQIDRESTVRKQIKLWETSTMKRNDKPIAKQIDKLNVLPELVDVKAKLRFWENAYHHSEQRVKDVSISKNVDDSSWKEERNEASNSISSGIKLEEGGEKENQVSSDHGSKRQTPSNINDSTWLEKSVDNKVLNNNSTKSKTRSFSDPGVLDKPDNDLAEEDTLHLGFGNENINPPSSKDEMSSSNDGNFIELFADDEESSMELLCSTEDEYIDDEISENISTYWGDLSLMKDLKAYDSSEYEEFLQLMNSESLQSCADECKFFGIATYFGHVAVKNRFWVLTKGAGRGNLSASVQGIGQHNVAFLSVEYTRKDIYEVTYQVFTPGLYLISVRWMDTPISGSPFLCKVTF